MKVKSLINIHVNYPIGEMVILCNENNLLGIYYNKVKNLNISSTFPVKSYAGKHQRIVEEINEYFFGKRKNFTIDFQFEGTVFQKEVWQELLKIPYGETRSYGEIANNIGYPKAARAVGMACNKNPFSIIVPCHRVVGKAGDLTGYAGGLKAKKWLLEFERNTIF